MIGSGLKKLAKTHGMTVANGIAYGSLMGYATTFSEGAGYKSIAIATNFPEAGQQERLLAAVNGIAHTAVGVEKRKTLFQQTGKFPDFQVVAGRLTEQSRIVHLRQLRDFFFAVDNKNFFRSRVSGNAPYFGMRGIAEYDQFIVFFQCGSGPVQTLDAGTSGINNMQMTRSSGKFLFPSDTVRAEKDDTSFWNFRKIIHKNRAVLQHFFTDTAVVDQFMKNINRPLKLLSGLLKNFQSTAYTRAKSAGNNGTYCFFTHFTHKFSGFFTIYSCH